MTFKTELAEIEKGCGKVTDGNEEFGTMNCGDMWGHDEDGIWIEDEIKLCKMCLARKSQLLKDQEIHEKIMKETEDKYKKILIKLASKFGARELLLALGDFKDIDITEEELK